VQPTIYEIERIGSGFLAVMGRPRAGDWAADEFSGLAELGIRNVISLLEHGEAVELGLAEESSYCANARIAFYSFPIRDRGIPASPEALSVFACETYHRCAGGDSTLFTVERVLVDPVSSRQLCSFTAALTSATPSAEFLLHEDCLCLTRRSRCNGLRLIVIRSVGATSNGLGDSF
jgi:hypothetical protein